MFNFFSNKKYRPSDVRLEACSLCQLNCKTCYMRRENSGDVGKGYLKAKDFEKFLLKNPFVRVIELSDNGEIFLNPELAEIIKIAFEHNVTLTAFNGVNFNTVSDEVLRTLCFFPNFTWMSLSIDGASNEVYSQYRRNGNFDKVISNIKKLNEYKREFCSNTPLLQWQYIIMENTCDIKEIQKAKKLAQELDISIFFKKDWSGFIPPNLEEVEKETGLIYAESKMLNNHLKAWSPCVDFFKNPQINYDGRFLGCCVKFKNLYGINVFETGLEKALKSKIVRRTRKLLMGKYQNKKFAKKLPCYDCWYYKEMVKNNKFITKEDLK